MPLWKIAPRKIAPDPNPNPNPNSNPGDNLLGGSLSGGNFLGGKFSEDRQSYLFQDCAHSRKRQSKLKQAIKQKNQFLTKLNPPNPTNYNNLNLQIFLTLH